MIGDLIKIKPEQLPAVRKQRKRKPPLWKRAWVRNTLLTLIFLSLALYVTAKIWLRQFERRASEFDLSKMREFEVSTLIHDRNGGEIAQLAEENRRPVRFEDVPFHFIQCLLATEDGRFFEHQGVDYIGITRAAVAYAKTRKLTQGASTITQQLARQTYAKSDPSMLEKNLERKLTEIFLAKRIEENFTKNEILEMYLNRIYFGSGFYGVNAAALGYFGHPASELTIEESALLCGLLKNPLLYSPLKDPEKSLRERNQTFDRMVSEKMLSRDEAEKYKTRPLKLDPTKNTNGSSYVMEEISAEVTAVLEQYGYDEVAGQGLHIYTTLDVSLQKAAEESVQRRLIQLEKRPDYLAHLPEANTKDYRKERPRVTYEAYSAQLEAYNRGLRDGSIPPATPPPYPGYLQGAAIVLDNKSGDVLAMVGGRDYYQVTFNCATRALRPLGTVFFPFLYAAAFEGAAFPGTVLSDEPFDNNRIMVGGLQGILGEWGREGIEDKHKVKITARGALAQSMNGATARLGLEQVGLAKVRALADRAGLEPTKDLPSSLLGTSEASLRNLALAYTTFPNGGTRPASTRLVTRITDRNGRVIFERASGAGTHVPVTDPITAYMITSCLEDALSVGTGSPAAEYGLKRIDAAGKTGTHLDSKNLWFAGFTREITCAVWTGMWDRDETIFPDAHSNECALPIWVDIINASTDNYRPAPFPEPEKIETVELCAYTGMRASDQCYESRTDPETKVVRAVRTTYQEYVRPGFRVFGTCELHSKSASATTQDEAGGDAPPTITPGAGATNQARAIALVAPTVLGTDPYESLQSILKQPETTEGTTPGKNGPELINTPNLNETKVDLPVPAPVEID